MTDTTKQLTLQQLKDVRRLCLPGTAWRSIIDELISARDQLEAERQRADAICRDIRIQANDLKSALTVNKVLQAELAELKGDQVPVALTVWYGSMPESNGKENWTAILHRKGEGKLDGITIDRSEYPGRVLYAADRARYLIGEKQDRPNILSYDSDKRSNYIYPVTAPQKPVVLPVRVTEQDMRETFNYLMSQEEADSAANGFNQCLIESKAAIESAGGIVKDVSDERKTNN